jgi:hypothetical protein
MEQPEDVESKCCLLESADVYLGRVGTFPGWVPSQLGLVMFFVSFVCGESKWVPSRLVQIEPSRINSSQHLSCHVAPPEKASLRGFLIFLLPTSVISCPDLLIWYSFPDCVEEWYK